MTELNIQEHLSDKTKPLFAIGIAAELLGVSVHTLRMYETEGLILPTRTESQRRLYSQSDIERLQCIRKMIEVQGLNLAGIKAMMSLVPCWEIKPCREADRIQCEAFKQSVEPCWAIKSKPDYCSSSDCKTCPVYDQVTTCKNMKSLLKEHWKTA